MAVTFENKATVSASIDVVQQNFEAYVKHTFAKAARFNPSQAPVVTVTKSPDDPNTFIVETDIPDALTYKATYKLSRARRGSRTEIEFTTELTMKSGTAELDQTAERLMESRLMVALFKYSARSFGKQFNKYLKSHDRGLS